MDVDAAWGQFQCQPSASGALLRFGEIIAGDLECVMTHCEAAANLGDLEGL